MAYKNLLLLHGAIGAANQFEVLIPYLKDDYNCYTLNFSGHAGNTASESPLTIPLFAQDVLNLMDSHSVKRIDIFGYSMGGYVALYLAKHFPDRIGAIFTLATKFNWTPEGAANEAAKLNPAKIEEKLPAFAAMLKQRHGEEHWKAVLTQTAEMMLQLGAQPALSASDYSAVNSKTLVSVGDRDTMVSLEETIAVYRQLKDARLLVLPETQHPFEKLNITRISAEIKRFF